MKKCPPGVICIENVTMFFIVILVIIVSYIFYTQVFKQSSLHDKKRENIIIQNQIPPSNQGPGRGLFASPGYSFSNLAGDVLMNPYEAPLKDDGYTYAVPGLPFVPPGRVPVNVPTNIGAVDVGYRQYGILKPVRGSTKDNILPLMGRPVNTSRQMFQYYTISNQHNNVKLPIIVQGRSGTTEYGVNELFSGDRVLVEGDRTPYKVTIYDNDSIRYIPYL
jgi:hypothetical protein